MLFEEVAQRTGHHLLKQDQAVTTVCRLVENSPLAIELAASWTPLLSCAEIAKRIQADIDFLAAHTRNVSERHRSVRAVFDHSWKLLCQTRAQDKAVRNF